MILVKWTKGRLRGVESRYEGNCVIDGYVDWCHENRGVPAEAIESIGIVPEKWAVVIRQPGLAKCAGPMPEALADTWLAETKEAGGGMNDAVKIPWPLPIL